MKYVVKPGETFVEMVTGRKVRDNGLVATFGELPFSGDVDGKLFPKGETYTWVLFTDGSYWLTSEGQHFGIFALP